MNRIGMLLVLALATRPGIAESASRELRPALDGPAIPQSLQGEELAPLSLASADFDGDGVADLAAGFASPEGGLVVLYRGNADALYPHSPEARQRRTEGRFVGSPFLSTDRVLRLTAPPDFLFAGDFDADGHADLASAAAGGSSLRIHPGDGAWGFAERRSIALPGRLTALASGDVGRRDGLADLVVGVEGTAGFQTLIFQASSGAVTAAPLSFSFPESVSRIDVAADGIRVQSGPESVRLERIARRWTVSAVPGESAAAPPVPDETAATLTLRVDSHARGRLVLRRDGALGIVAPAAASTLVVNVTTNLADAAPGNGACADVNGACSLRAAIEESNALAGADTITFAIPGSGVPAISLPSLPTVTDTVTIDGTTQAGGRVAVTGTSNGFLLTFAAADCVVRGMVFNGTGNSAIRLLSDGSVVEGNFIGTNDDGTAPQGSFAVTDVLIQSGGSNHRIGGTALAARNVLVGAAVAIRVDAGSGHVIEGNFIGTDVTGTVDLGGTSQGVRIFGGSATIGGSAAGAGNVIAGYGQAGVELDTPGSLVQGNRIGTNAAGIAPIANGAGILSYFNDDATIGGTAPGAGNLVSGNTGDGVQISQNTVGEIVVQGNRIGTDASGAFAIANEGYGIHLVGATGALIGGPSAAARNVVSGNLLDGIFFTKFITVGPTGNVVQGNFIGTDATGAAAVPNLRSGIALEWGDANQIGGTSPGEGNVISGNFLHGIELSLTGNTTKNLIYGNRIGTNAFGNGPLGNGLAGIHIPLNTHGALIGGTGAGQANTIAFNRGAGIASSGSRALHVAPNVLHSNGGLGHDLFDDGVTANRPGATNNFPFVTLASDIGGGTSVAGYLDAKAATTFDVHIFSSLSCDPSGHGEGREYRKTVAVPTDAGGHGIFTTTITPAIPGGRYVTAYAVAQGPTDDSSEFSFCRQIQGGPPPEDVPLELFAVTPPQGGNTGHVTVTIAGQGMVPGTTARLEKAGSPDEVATDVAVSADGYTLTATFNLSGAALGAWDVTVNVPGDSATLPGAFTVVAGAKASVWTDIIGRGTLAVRAGREQTFFLVYGNNGNVDSEPTHLRVTVPWQLQVTFVDRIAGVSPVVMLDRPVLTGGTGQTWIELYLKTVPASSSGTLAIRVKTIAAQPGEFGEKISFKVWRMSSAGLAYLFQNPPDPAVSVTPELLVDQPDHFQARLHVTNGVLSGDLDFDATFAPATFETRPTLSLTPDGAGVRYGFAAAYDPIAPPLPGTPAPLRSKATRDGFLSSIGGGLSGNPQVGQLLSKAGGAEMISQAIQQLQTIGDNFEDLGGQGLPPDVLDALSKLSAAQTALDGLPPTQSPGFEQPSQINQAEAERILADLSRVKKELDDFIEEQKKRDRDRHETIDETCGCPPTQPFTLSCPDPDTGVTHDDVTIYESIDPNAKSGPTGAGAARYIDGQTPLPYTITFENLETASAAAQEVIVTDQLDGSKLDLASFELGPIAFGTHVIPVPPGLQSYTADVDLRPAVALVARVAAAFDPSSGLATWHFFSLDPNTGQPTEDAILGFLPPNVATPEGEGHVSFTVRAKSGLATGTAIHNAASIVFDANPAIETADWLNTIDVTPPTSQVAALPPSSCSAIQVQWSGADPHSGVVEYDIFVSENGGSFVPWKTQTEATSATFFGSPGSNYAFYSIARDGAGNAEAPGGADATTVAGSPSPLVDALEPDSGPATGAAVALTGSGFEAGASVLVGGQAAGGVTVNGPTSLDAIFPALAPGALYDVTAANASACSDTLAKAWFADFLDVSAAHPFHDFVETIVRHGVTAGCSGGNYCVSNTVTRAQMAVFLIKGKYDLSLVPAPATGTLFADVPAGSFGADWIEQIAKEGITGGCGSGNYCPGAAVTRKQMAVFLLKSKHGALYVPPPAAGVFLDVPANDPFAPWIEQLAAEQITGGCGGNNYCPDNPVNRGQMAVFLSKTFGY